MQAWRGVAERGVGVVHCQKVKYRDFSDAVSVPVTWELRTPSEWVAATQSGLVKREFQTLSKVVAAADSQFHPLLVRQRRLVLGRPEAEVIRACELACLLEPGCAQGAPLRALALAGIDSKFFERHRSLILKLLDVRFDGTVSELGLEAFLGALSEDDHWLLVADLDGGYLPFTQLRVRDKELASVPLQAERIILVENERCLYHLPKLQGAVAILGAGLNLSWLSASWLTNKRLAYWGDIDTWGLTMLARARLHQPSLTPLLMTRDIFDQHLRRSVREPMGADSEPPLGLTDLERALYLYLLEVERGRLEQEFLPRALVEREILAWAYGSRDSDKVALEQ